MNNEKWKYYNKIVDLLLDLFKDLTGSNSYMRSYDISDRKNRIIIKNFGESFSRDNILFCEKFLFFGPDVVVTFDKMYHYAFEADDKITPNRVLDFENIKKIKYGLMPCRTYINITSFDDVSSEIFNGVPNAETYSDVKLYSNSVNSGYYKVRTICILACIYALSALKKCKENEYEITYKKIEANIKKLKEYQQDKNNYDKKYGNFFSFEFVECDYDSEKVEYNLDLIESAKGEAREEERMERRENIERALERKFEETREQYEKMKQ